MKKVFLYFAALAVCVSCLDKETNDDPVTFSGLSMLSSTAVSDAKYVALLADEARSRSGAYGNGELCRIDADGVMSALDFEFSLECTDPEAEKEVRRWLKEDVSFSFGGMTVVHDKYLYLKYPSISTAVDENAGEDPYFILKDKVLSELCALLAPPDRQVFVVLRLSDGRVFLPSEQQFPDIDKNWWHYSPDNGETVYFTDSFCGGNLYRLSHGDGDLDVELICSDTGDSQSYVVDASGNLICYNYTDYYSANSTGNRGDALVYVPATFSYRILYANGVMDDSMSLLPEELKYRNFFSVAGNLYAYVSDGNNSVKEDPDRASTHLYRIYVGGTGKMTAEKVGVFYKVYYYSYQLFRVEELSNGRFLIADDCAHQWGIHSYNILCDPSAGTYDLREFDSNWGMSWSGAAQDGIEYNFYQDERKIVWFDNVTMETGEEILEYPDGYIWIKKQDSNDWAGDDLEGYDAQILVRGLKKSGGSPVTLILSASENGWEMDLVENLDDRQVTSLLKIN